MEVGRATLRGVGGGGRRRFYAHVSSPRNGSMLEIARPAGEYEVSRLRFRQGLRSSPRSLFPVFQTKGKT